MQELKMRIEAQFSGAADFVRRSVRLRDGGAAVVYAIDGLVAGVTLGEDVVKPLVQGDAVYTAVQVPVEDADKAAWLLVNGFCVVVWADHAAAYEVKTPEKRSVSAPTVENTVKGAKDAFTETNRTNTSLIRRHLRTPDLRIFETQVGRRSLTNVSVLSIEGVTNPDLVARVKQRLAEIDVDGLISPAAAEEYLTGSRKTAFPLVSFTERTDKFCHGLLSGRVGVIVDGLPLGYLLPVDLAYLLHSPEDRGKDYITASCVRILRYIALLVSLLLPGLYVAAAYFHPEMLPTQLLSLQVYHGKTALVLLAAVLSGALLLAVAEYAPCFFGWLRGIIRGKK